MAMSNSNFSLVSIDPDTNKSNFINYLKGQPLYTDYNFAGSNWNVLLDVLSRNTFLSSFYLNMAFTESFLSSAQLRDNVVSRAKELNYIPTSVASSFTSVNIIISTQNLTSFEIPAQTGFSGRNSNGTYIFRTDDTLYQSSVTGKYTFSNVVIYEGNYLTDSFTMDYAVNNQIFTISNPLIDISSLVITTSEDNGSVNTSYNLAEDIFGVNGNSTVFYLQGTTNNQYQFYFGDGILGYKPQNGAIITANYRVSFGAAADAISNFTLISDLAGLNGGTINTITITSLSPSDGGANAEGIESIRFNAPLAYQTQDRVVVPNDYKISILTQFPAVGDVYTYPGGISNVDVEFGTVYIACVDQLGNPLTQVLKNNILSFLNSRAVINLQRKMIDANTIYINILSNVHINFSGTTTTALTFQQEVINTISTFSNTYLGRFNTPFRYSQLTTTIDNIDPAVISNETEIKLLMYYSNVEFNTSTNILLNFGNPIVSVNSYPFISSNNNTSYISDTIPQIYNTAHNLYLICLGSNGSIVTNNIIGSINYANGILNISNLIVSSFPNDSLAGLGFIAVPQDQDIYANQNSIIQVNTVDGITVNILDN